MPTKSSLSEILSTYGKIVKELANETAATSKRPYGRINETWCATPTNGFDEVLMKIRRKKKIQKSNYSRNAV
jgi:hypothetical protein